jgi:hypothetical protein
MSGGYRHHHAVKVVFVEVPQAGSPAPLRNVKPRPYPATRREPWLPRRAVPSNSKAVATKRLLNSIMRQDEIVRETMRPNAALWRAWLTRSAARCHRRLSQNSNAASDLRSGQRQYGESG